MQTEKSMIHQAMMKVVRPTVSSNLLMETGLMGRCERVFIRRLIDVRLFNIIVVFSVAITVQKRGNCSLAHTVVHTADMTISAVQNVYDTTDILSVD